MRKISDKSKAYIEGLLDYIGKTGEQNILPEIAKSLEKEAAKSQKENEIIVTSAVRLTPQQLKNIKKILENLLNVKFPIVNKINKNLIAGFTIRVNDWFWDSSLSYQIEQFKRLLLS